MKSAPIRLLSYKHPGLQFFVSRMKRAYPDLAIVAKFVSFDDVLALGARELRLKPSPFDLIYVSDTTCHYFAKNGWLLPLNDLWLGHANEFSLDDFSKEVIDMLSYQSNLYAVPHSINTQLLFYRKDLLDKEGIKVPRNIAEYREIAANLHTRSRSGIVSAFRPVDAALNELHWYMNALGPGWFDKDRRPIFQTDSGVHAMDLVKELAEFSQPGFMDHANEECIRVLQRDAGVMGLQWATRAASIDQSRKSMAVGVIDWTVPPDGHHKIAVDGFAISASTRHSHEDLFRIIGYSSSSNVMRSATHLILPPRQSILSDPSVAAFHKHYPAALEALKTGTPFPRMPEFYPIGQLITRRASQVLMGELDSKTAMVTAARETEDLLSKHGYYA